MRIIGATRSDTKPKNTYLDLQQNEVYPTNQLLIGAHTILTSSWCLFDERKAGSSERNDQQPTSVYDTSTLDAFVYIVVVVCCTIVRLLEQSQHHPGCLSTISSSIIMPFDSECHSISLSMTTKKRVRKSTVPTIMRMRPISRQVLAVQTVVYVVWVMMATLPSSFNTVAAAPVLMHHIRPRRARETIMRSIPALSVYHSVKTEDEDGIKIECDEVVEVAVKQKQKKKRFRSLSQKLSSLPIDGKAMEGGGFYYGLSRKELKDGQDHHGQTKRQKQPRLQDSISEAVEELRSLREDIERMRQEIKDMREKILGVDESDAQGIDGGDSSGSVGETLWQRREKQIKADKLALQIESWAQSMLQETEDDGWKRVECNKVVRSTLNPSNRTVAFVKWMKDSREDQADQNDEETYPCIKCYATIDAPLEAVCSYLAEKSTSPDYNDVVKKHQDLEEISPNAKICWSQSPQILFIKPRDFVTFCHHRWKSDGTEVIVNQASEHPAAKISDDAVRGYALRGANCKYKRERRVTM
jgi:hypothetical protein